MRPLTLQLSAFGPFAGEERIDFAELGRNPLFLINGPTGAGKSSILDAICFALYGATTGAEREAAQMRCDHAPPEQLTEVTLRFQLGDNAYRVRRLPTQERPKARGEGTTTQQAEAQLWHETAAAASDEGALLARGVKEVGEQVRALIGLDVEQFRQVMVLPQGKFRELLMADSKERERIFGQLFQTRIYRRIEEALKEQAAGIRRAVEQHQEQVRGILAGADLASEAAIAEERQQLLPALAQAEQQRGEAAAARDAAATALEQGRGLAQRFQQLARNREQLAALQARGAEVQAWQQQLQLARTADALKPDFERWQQQLRTLQELERQRQQAVHDSRSAEQALKQAQQQYDSALQRQGEVDGLKQQLHSLQGYRDQLTRLEQARADLAAAQQRAEQSRQALEAQQQRVTEQTKEQSTLEARLAELDRALEPWARQQLELQTLAQQRQQRQELESLREQYKALSQAGKQAQQELEQAEAGHRAAKQRADETELRWHRGQAALLARELRVDEPCPVCGSREHPQPATPQAGEELVTVEQVEAARGAEASARQKLQAAQRHLDEAQRAQKDNRNSGRKLADAIGPLAERPLADIEAAEKALQALLAAQQLRHEERQRTNQRLQQLRTEIAQLSAAMGPLEAGARDDQEARVVAVSTLQNVEQQLPESYRQPGALERQRLALEQQINGLEIALQQAQDGVTQARSRADKAQATLEALSRQHQQAASDSQEATSAWEQRLAQSPFADPAAFERACADAAGQQRLEQQISGYQSELERVRGGVEALQRELADQAAPDLAALHQALEQHAQAYTLADECWRKRQQRHEQLQGVERKLAKAREQHAELEAAYAIYGTLSEVANGQTGDKISLQRFVLSVLLDDVLIQASQRLYRMSQGRYRLVRKAEKAKGNKASGLDLEVEDGYTGKNRPVATLSGGESFLAALSLALGLSDVVQAYAGGIKLDTLFIDEGFGSLDPESLDLAVRTLIDLQASGRMIGIISHVSELKEQMALRLDVLASRDGSQVRLVTG